MGTFVKNGRPSRCVSPGQSHLFPEWQRLCFDKEMVYEGVQGGCCEEDCFMGRPTCKIRQLVNRGIISERTALGGSTLIQHTCGVPDSVIPRFLDGLPTGDECEGRKRKRGKSKGKAS